MAARPSRLPGGGFSGAMKRLRPTEATRDNSIDKVLARISQTADGQLLLQWIYQQSHGRALPEGAPEGALREHAALNRFATTIFNNVDRGLTPNAGSPKK